MALLKVGFLQDMRERPSNARTERAGLFAVGTACNNLDLIWRDLLQEDVGVDGTIEIVADGFPSGKLVGAQVKSGASYIRSETDKSFKFYPKDGDLEYWTKLSIPFFLLVHDPRSGKVYWADVTKHVQDRGEDPVGSASIQLSKTNILDEEFAEYLRARFDLTAYCDDQFERATTEFEAIVYRASAGDAVVEITGIDLFIMGLWGLCSKLQFHLSLLTGIIRRAVHDRSNEVAVRYTFSRAGLYPFLTQYFNAIGKHNFARIDVEDVNQSLYGKLEIPTFIAPLSTNGRRFVQHLRKSGRKRVHDNQHFTLALIPHEQIEVYQSYRETSEGGAFGPYTDVIAISFNPYLDYYHVEHWHRKTTDASPVKIISQSIFYYELIEYVTRTLGDVPRDNVMLRHFDTPLSPFIAWLLDWYEWEPRFPSHLVAGKSNAEQFAFHEEMTSILTAAGVISVNEPQLSTLPVQDLASGEILNIDGVA